MISGASQKIRKAISPLEGVTEHPHRFGGVEFRLGKRELGHLHGDSLLDIPFPMNVRNELVSKGEVEEHHLLKQSGWISFYLKNDQDVAKAIELLTRSFVIAVESTQRRTNAASR